MNISVKPFDLFSTRIWAFDLSALAENFADWRVAVTQWRCSEPGPVSGSNRSGWNSAKTVFEQSRFASLNRLANAAFQHALKQMAPEREIPFRLEAWVNVNDPGGYNLPHVHQNVLLSGCFYLSVPAGSGDIGFKDPRPGVILSSFLGAGANANQGVSVSPVVGTLLVFPNWLEHHVEANMASSERQSIAMNAIAC